MLHIENDDFIKLTEFIKARYGLNLADRKVLVESRLSNYVLDCGFDSFADYLNLVYGDSTQREVANMINRLTTNHTYFMRESTHFSHMMETFLPIAEKQIKDRMLCIWSAGCSFGNEPYNIAMCLDDYFGMKRYQWDMKILATDISFKHAFHLIYCRNVMIYFNEETKSRLCKKLYAATEPGGYLYIGHAESAPAAMMYLKESTAIYRKEGDLR